MKRSARRAMMFALVKKYNSGTESRRDFCTRHKLALPTFAWWLHEFRKVSSGAVALKPQFVRLNPVPLTSDQHQSSFVLHLCDSVRLEIPARIGIEHLLAIVNGARGA